MNKLFIDKSILALLINVISNKLVLGFLELNNTFCSLVFS